MDAMRSKRGLDSLSGGLFLIGLGLIFLLHVGVWPWILVVIGAAQLPVNLARQRGWLGWQGFFWLAGLAILFATGWFWPGILILLGVNMLVGAMTKESAGSPFADKEPEPDVAPTPQEPSEPETPEEHAVGMMLTPSDEEPGPRPTREL